MSIKVACIGESYGVFFILYWAQKVKISTNIFTFMVKNSVEIL